MGQTVYGLVFSGMLFGLGSGGVYTPLACQVVEHAPVEYRNTAMGFFMLNIELGQTLGALVMGSISHLLSYPRMFLIAGFLPIIGVFIVLGSTLGRGEKKLSS